MTRATQVIRSRRRRGVGKKTAVCWLNAGLVLMTSAVLAIGIFGVLTALAFAESESPSASVQTVEFSFIQSGREIHTPVRFWDRERNIVLFEALHPEAQSRRWYQIDPNGPIVLPEYVIQTSYSAQGGDFWSRRSGSVLETLNAFAALLDVSPEADSEAGILDLIAEAQVLPLSQDIPTDPKIWTFQRQLATTELNAKYPRIELLEIYLNTADYGNLAYGIDAAALVYFGKHASSLTLAESAFLAPIPFDPDINPFDAPEQARANQRELLIRMRNEKLISPSTTQRALSEKLRVVEPSGSESISATGRQLMGAFEERFGQLALGRSGLNVVTTIDADLQEQSKCMLEIQIARLNNDTEPGTETGIADSDCLASALLPPLRPGDINKDHKVRSGALVVIDATNGEVLSLVGDLGHKRPMGAVAQPFVYLTAFAEGYSPGSMVMDLPLSPAIEGEVNPTPEELERYHGPVRIRTALANGYIPAAEQMVELVGVESVLRIFETMGVQVEREAGQGPVSWQAALLDLAHASSVFARGGVLHGIPISNGLDTIRPILVREILDEQDRLVFTVESGEKAVLSEQLAYLVNDVLSDENTRRATLGPSNPLEINRPVGALATITESGRDAWALGYTPTRVVGVWMGNPTGSAPVGLTARNSTAAVWHAVMKYASRDLAPEDWTMPAGVTRIEVCDPSGLLPTVYCPESVREPFIVGTEPTTFDNMFQPYLVNRETGKLATLSTPAQLVEERVYLVPPPEAMEWASAVGIEQPPQEYDTLTANDSEDPDLRITAPDPFAFLRGTVRVRGVVDLDALDFYRLQVGKGLNPTNWIQLGDDSDQTIRGGVISEWDTSELEGLYTLQLVAVEADGQVQSAVVHVTVDNEPPSAEIVFPEAGQVFTGERTDEIAIQVEARDSFGLERVVFYIDDDEVAVVDAEPFSIRWPMISIGRHEVYAEVHDIAGNSITTETMDFSVVRP